MNIRAEERAAQGTVSIQDMTIEPRKPMFNASNPLARPTPVTDPTTIWLDEMGIPNIDARKTVEAVAKLTEKPLELFNVVMPSPTARITLCPHVETPITMPSPPSISSHLGTSTHEATAPLSTTE